MAARRGELVRRAGCPFDVLAKEWLAEQETLTRRGINKPGTYQERRAAVEHHLIPYFGDLAVNQITKADVSAFRSYKLGQTEPRTYSPKTLQNWLGAR